MTESDRRMVQAYLDRPLDDLMAELNLHTAETRGIGEFWQQIVEPLRQRICVEWDWCRVRKQAHFKNDMDLAVAVIGALSAQVLRLPIQVDLALIAAILVKGGLNVFCACE
ncbi:MAG: hypothetical protein CVU38_15975 [Chloroflexi bacterium HGW-Chloroflexi-1]|nr:MAG: hypothetical protein CVU38_15975 [Chloroflexi bacterium HGW-Chloroflexi-1]